MASQHYLKFNGPELHRILGIGDFHADLPALPVPESIANQYDTEEMKALGWVVWKNEPRATDSPQADSQPVEQSSRLAGGASD
jgi:hypothetical protein